MFKIIRLGSVLNGPDYVKMALIVFFAATLTHASLKLLDVTFRVQRLTFIDEIFHIPQAQRYCRHEWTKWNPKITTPPGLYIISYILLKPFHKLGIDNFCTTYTLRSTNLLGTVLNYYLAFKISCCLEQKYKLKSSTFLKALTAFNVAIFPPLYFFTFLYYTDVWSTSFVLLMYYVHLRKGKFYKIEGAFAGFMAVLMRQTNIVWVGLMIIDDIWNILSKNSRVVTVQDYKFSKNVLTRFISDLICSKSIFKKLRRQFMYILSATCHNVMLCVMFLVFVIINQSIVLGDKEAHTATFHPMQNLYFLNFCLFFAWPFLVFEVIPFCKKPHNIFLILLFIGLCAGLSEFNKLEHPYLLADNRHLSFYIWKRIFGHPILRRMIVPLYVGSAMLLWRLLRKRCHFMSLVMLSVCIIINLTPQYLFELRYFIIPFLMCRLQFKQTAAVVLETVFFLMVNTGAFYLFINRSFVWDSQPNMKQRFIW